MRSAGGRIGGVAGALGAVLAALGLTVMPGLPGPDTTAPEVFSYFLDDGNSFGAGAALLGIGLVLVLVLFATARALAGDGADGPSGRVMLALAQVGVVLQAAALGLVVVLGARADEADPATARSLLDLSDALAGFSGAALALAFAATARLIRRSGRILPARFAEAAIAVAAGCALWTIRLFTDAGAFAPDSFLGSEIGWLLMIAWLLAAGLWMGSGRLDEPEPAPEPQART